MASTYPNTLDSFATNRTDGTASATTHAADHDNENDAINKIEAELGTNPRGAYATVAARLAAIAAIPASVPLSTVTAAGDLIYGTANAVVTRLAIGVAGRVLVSTGTAPSWVDPATLGTTVVTNVQTGTTYTLVLTDQDKVLEFTNASAVTVTVPPNSSVAFPIGTVIEVLRYGAGEVALSPGTSVSLQSPSSARRLNLQYSSAVLRKRGTDEWMLEGDIKV